MQAIEVVKELIFFKGTSYPRFHWIMDGASQASVSMVHDVLAARGSSPNKNHPPKKSTATPSTI